MWGQPYAIGSFEWYWEFCWEPNNAKNTYSRETILRQSVAIHYSDLFMTLLGSTSKKVLAGMKPTATLFATFINLIWWVTRGLKTRLKVVLFCFVLFLLFHLFFTICCFYLPSTPQLVKLARTVPMILPHFAYRFVLSAATIDPKKYASFQLDISWGFE